MKETNRGKHLNLGYSGRFTPWKIVQISQTQLTRFPQIVQISQVELTVASLWHKGTEWDQKIFFPENFRLLSLSSALLPGRVTCAVEGAGGEWYLS